MESWLEIQKEIMTALTKGGPAGGPDFVRRKAYSEFAKKTGRPLIVYATAFEEPVKAQLFGPMMSIGPTDKDGFQEVCRNINGNSVDILVHSPGGSAEATESIVSILRNRFDDIRFIVTGSAKSAATMLVMAGNCVLLSKAGELGPTDPQLFVGNGRPAPAGSILEQFQLAKKEIATNPSSIGTWMPILQYYGPALLVECKNHLALSRKLVSGWLRDYMFNGDPDAPKKAAALARFLSTDKNFLSHGRRIDYQMLVKKGAKVFLVEDQDIEFQRLLSRVHLCVGITLANSDAFKIFENSEGAALIRQAKLPRP